MLELSVAGAGSGPALFDWVVFFKNVVSSNQWHCPSSRRSSAGSDGPWTPPRMPTTRTRLRWWSAWTVWRRLCSGPGRVASTASRAGKRAVHHNSPPPVWFWTTARGRSTIYSPDLGLRLKNTDMEQNLVNSSKHCDKSTLYFWSCSLWWDDGPVENTHFIYSVILYELHVILTVWQCVHDH